jgi:CheY-like chemotaxis protein/HPt (histidine-containing phosphotransfer) domain-containing protein
MFSHSGKKLAKFLAHFQQAQPSHRPSAEYSSCATTAADIYSTDFDPSSQGSQANKTPKEESSEDEDRMDLSFFKVLVAEDNIINQKILQKMLQKMGIRFKIVGNGVEALEALRNDYFDMVLMDCYMPEMSGFDAAAVIRTSEERFANIPLIAISAGFFDGYQKTGCDVGMNDFLMKPVTYEQLRAKIQKWAHRVFEGLSVLDTSSLDKIRVFDDQHQTLLRSLFQIYSENTQDELYKLRDLILDGREELIRKKAHMLKSSAAQLGAFRFEKFCILMEHEEVLDGDRAKKLFVGMSEEYENSRKLFSEYCQSLSQISNVLI